MLCLNTHTLCANFGLNTHSLGNFMILLKIMPSALGMSDPLMDQGDQIGTSRTRVFLGTENLFPEAENLLSGSKKQFSGTKKQFSGTKNLFFWTYENSHFLILRGS